MSDNPNYWKLQRTIKKLKEKDNRCFVCGSKEKIVPHHLKKVKQTSEEYYSENNIVLLCDVHHRQYHRQYSNVNPKTFSEFLRKNHSNKTKRQKMNFRLDAELKISKLKKIIKLLNKTQNKVVKISVNGKLYDFSKIIENEDYAIFEPGDFKLINNAGE